MLILTETGLSFTPVKALKNNFEMKQNSGLPNAITSILSYILWFYQCDYYLWLKRWLFH